MRDTRPPRRSACSNTPSNPDPKMLDPMTCGRLVAETQLDDGRSARRHRERVVRRGLGASLLRVHRIAAPIDDVFVDPVLEPAGLTGRAVDARDVRLVVGEQPLGLTVGVASTDCRSGRCPREVCAATRPTVTAWGGVQAPDSIARCSGTRRWGECAAEPRQARDSPR